MSQRSRLISCLSLTVLLIGGAGPLRLEGPPVEALEQPAGKPSFSKDILPFLAKNCFSCHGHGKKRGDLSLDGYKDELSVQKDRDVWEIVIEMLKTGEMPPAKAKPRPTPSETAAAVQAIDAVLAEFDCKTERNPGRVTIRRLNRSEYNNTIRDLVGIDFKPAADFPTDDTGYGFDNIGDVLSVSPLLLEKYLTAAESILEQAIVIDDPPQPMKTKLGGLRASFGAGGVRRGGGMFLNKPGRIAGESFLDEGDYIIRAEVFGQQVGDEPVRAAIRVSGDDVKEFVVKAEDAEPETIETKIRLKTGTRSIGVAFLNPYTAPKTEAELEAENDKPKEEEAKKEPAVQKKVAGLTPVDVDTHQRLLFVRSIVVDGPYNTPAPVLPETHKRIMAHKPDVPPREAAREIVGRFATRAFRRPVEPGELDALLKLYDLAEKEGERFENRVKLALYGVLVRPQFLFRVELDPPGAEEDAIYPINEYELASRLSYFLWSSMPDDALFELASQGQLRANLEAQVRRMLQDPKSAAFVQNFAGQWLTLRNLANVNPDTKTFPSFDEELRTAMHRETEMFFEAILREDRSIVDFIHADFSFVNERLAKHYGIEGVTGKEFRRVTMPKNRRGVLTHASILTVTSNSTRTAPVKRGKWILEQILSSPPPPPPPDVPPLPETEELTGSLRKVMEQHRENAICASCHQRMDPIGFAFENYDAIGAWRDMDGKFPIDPSGVLPGGQSFQGPDELEAILETKKDVFGRALGEKVLTYALGRGLEYYDKCAVDKVVEALEKNDYRFSALVVEVVKSEPFQLRTATGEKP